MIKEQIIIKIGNTKINTKKINNHRTNIKK